MIINTVYIGYNVSVLSQTCCQNKKDEIPDPMEETYKGGKKKYLSQNLINNILEKYKNKTGKNVEIESKLVKIEGTSMNYPVEVYNSLYKKPFVRLEINIETNGKKYPPYVIGYLPQQYTTVNADLEVYLL